MLPLGDMEATPVTVNERPPMRRSHPAVNIGIGMLIAAIVCGVIVMFAGCVAPQKPPAKPAPKLGASLIFPGSGTSGGGGGGSVTQGTTPWVVAGQKTNNNAAPGADGVQSLPALANAADPTWTEGRLVLQSTDLTGYLRALVKGTVTANAGTNLNTSALALDSSVASLSLAQNAATAGQRGILNYCAVTTAAPSYTTAQSSPCSLTLAGALRVDGSAVTQPISAASLPLPTGAATSSNQTTLGSQTTKVNDGTNTMAVKAASTAAAAADPSAVVGLSPNSPLPTGSNTIGSISNVSGTVSLPTGAATSANQTTIGNQTTKINDGTNTSAVKAASTAVAAADPALAVSLSPNSPVTNRTVSSANNTGTCTSVTTSSTTVLASNASRKAYGFKAPSTNTVAVFCKLGATATTSNVPFEAGSSWSQDNGAVYTGVIDCITASSSSSICVYEFN